MSVRRAFHRTALFASVALVATLVLSAPLTASARQTTAGDAPPDLSAMMLTPEDLEDAGLEGYGARTGWTDTLDDELIGLLTGGSLDEADVEDILSESGLIRSRVVQFDLPSEEDPGFAARRVTFFVDEHESDDGIEEVVELYTSFAGSEEEEGTEEIGDVSRLISHTTTNDDGTELEGMTLAFALDNLIGMIEVVDFIDFTPDEPVTIEEIEGLALALAERMEAVVDGDGPGLESRLYRLESDGIDVYYTSDYYSRLDGDALALYGETPDDTEARADEAESAGATDVYELGQVVTGNGDTAFTWSVRVWRFEDEDAASAWLQDAPAVSEGLDDVDDVTEADELRRVGDEAVAWSFSVPGGDPDRDDRAFWSGTAVRVGTDVALIYLARWGDVIPAEIMDELVEGQAECLEEGCVAESPLPDGMLELAAEDNAGPADTGDEPSDDPDDEPDDEPTEEPADEPSDDLTDEPSDDPADEPSDEPTGDVTEADLLDRVETFDDLSTDHTDEPVEYEQVPPAGGMHHDVPQTCGFYDEPIGSERAVHSLEHGAVWVTYDAEELSRSDVRALEDLADEHDYLLVSPFEGLPSPVVASAWGVQIQLDGVDDPYLIAFIDYFEEGPQTPEPGAACAGTAETVS